jgi:hypothetical protein
MFTHPDAPQTCVKTACGFRTLNKMKVQQARRRCRDNPMRCELSPLAEFDLEEIGDYIARYNPSRAVSFVRAIRECCVKIADNPQQQGDNQASGEL